MTNEQILSILFPDGKTSIGQTEEYEETLEILSTPEGKAELEVIAKSEIYHDIEHDTYITKTELKAEYEQLYAEGETETDTFEGYLKNCLTKNNGILEVVA